jgi:parallel beta-helix repeat protein/predicted outer membrane repeat protein
MEVTMRTCVLLLTFLFLLVFTSTTHAVTVHVPDDFPTIQAGIVACTDGDTVIVRDGTYTGNGNRDIDFAGKAIVLMSENGPEFTIIDCQGSLSEYHRGFYFHSGEDANTVLQGFTIMKGYQTTGGGIYCYLSSPTITGNIIAGNTASNDGSGIYCINSSPTIVNNVITENLANDDGGGVYCNNSSPTITNNTISSNTANDDGGGIRCENYSIPTINYNTVTENTAIHLGGGIHCGNSSPSITNNIITGNWGGGIRCYYSSPTITNNIIAGNTTVFHGGGIRCYISSPTIINNIIAGNSADGGGGISCETSSFPTITNNTITGNTAVSPGGGILCSDSSSPTIINTILWDNSSNEISGNGSPVVTYSDVQGGWSGEGNIDADPLFVTFHGFDYLLGRGSPCIDAGDPAIEDGRAWPIWYNNGLRSDMGVYGGPSNVGWWYRQPLFIHCENNQYNLVGQ